MKILVLCTYPIRNPRHGGQLRVRNIVDAYRAAGHKVKVLGVLSSTHYERENGFLSFPSTTALSSIISNPFLMEDYSIGRLFSSDPKYYEKLVSLISEIPDLIHVEQPWLFELAQRYIKNQPYNIKLIYSSQNVEWLLKKEILSTYFEKEVAEQSAEIIKRLEIKAIANADAVICVSENDSKWIGLHTDKPLVIAPNGAKLWNASKSGIKAATSITLGNPYALYCASSHPPNITGFFDMFGGGFGSLKPDEKLVVAGSAGWAIAGDERVHQSPKLAEKVTVAGVVSQNCLEGLLSNAHCIVLPITQGGGTNLKTAEAIWSGKHIVATSVAMRGFESFIGARGIQVADNSTDFKRALRLAMTLPSLKLSNAEMEIRNSVCWDSCLKPLLKLINSFETGLYNEF